MLDRDDSSYREDSLGVFRGLMFGVLIGAVLWAVLIGAAYYWFIR